MTGKTHKRISLQLAYLIWGLYNLLVSNTYTYIWEYYILCMVVAEFCKEGTLFPDLDHNWQSVKEKTVLTKIVNLFIRLTGGKHRSRHTHSWDLCLLLGGGSIFAIYKFMPENFITYLFLYIVVGFVMGWATHLFADMLTKDGVYLFCFNKKRIAFVPSHFLGINFKTGDTWEEFCYNTARILEGITFVFAMLVPIIKMYATQI